MAMSPLATKTAWALTANRDHRMYACVDRHERYGDRGYQRCRHTNNREQDALHCDGTP